MNLLLFPLADCSGSVQGSGAPGPQPTATAASGAIQPEKDCHRSGRVLRSLGEIERSEGPQESRGDLLFSGFVGLGRLPPHQTPVQPSILAPGVSPGVSAGCRGPPGEFPRGVIWGDPLGWDQGPKSRQNAASPEHWCFLTL